MSNIATKKNERNLTGTNDIIFKIIFKENLELVKLAIETLTDIKVDTLELVDTHAEDNVHLKVGIMDLTVKVNDKMYCIIEMNQNKAVEKEVMYFCKVVVKQLRRGEAYDKIMPVVTIAFDNYRHFNKSDKLYQKVHFQTDDTQVDNRIESKIRVCLPTITKEWYNPSLTVKTTKKHHFTQYL